MLFSDNLKLKRINNALNINNHFFSDDNNIDILNEKIKINQKNQESILNSKLMNSVLKYIVVSKRQQIIAQRVIERYKEN